MNRNLVSPIINNISKFSDEIKIENTASSSENQFKLTGKEFSVTVNQLSQVLINEGIKKCENIGIFSQNIAQWIIADVAIMSIKAVTVPIYATNSVSQAGYIIGETEIRYLFVGENEQYVRALELYDKPESSLEKIIVFDETLKLNRTNSIHFSEFLKSSNKDYTQEINERQKVTDENDTATIIYTSGTTGEPKGVELTHGNLLHAFKLHDNRLDLSSSSHSLSFLPLSHVFEHAWSLYCLYKGMKITFLSDPKKVIEVLGEIKPTAICSVPRLYQKVYQTILSKIEESSKLKQKIFFWAQKVGKEFSELKRKNQKISFLLKLKYEIGNLIIFKKIRNIFGGNMEIMPCAGSALSSEITEFFHAAGLPLVIGYGLSETTATVSVFPDNNYEFGSVGTKFPELEVKIEADNEIWVKGKTIMKAYYKKPEETSKVFDGEWFKTGDAGSIDKNGNIYIIERIKDLMKTAGGKYIAPQLVESLLTNDKYIEQAILIADDKPYATALLVPNFEALKKHASTLILKYNSNEELISTKKIKEFYEKKVDDLQKSLSNFEKIKKIRLLSDEFSMALNELTPTLKIKRSIIIQKFMHLIDDMYVTK